MTHKADDANISAVGHDWNNWLTDSVLGTVHTHVRAHEHTCVAGADTYVIGWSRGVRMRAFLTFGIGLFS